MPSATPSTEVFAFSTPVVKTGTEIDIAVRVPGGLHVLRGSRSVWAGLFHHLRSLFEPQRAAAMPATKSPTRGRAHGNRLSNERAALYIAAHREYHDDPAATRKAIAAKYCLGMHTWENWCRNHRDELEADRAPITKPNGRIL